MLIGFVTGVLSGFGVGGGTLLLIWLTAFVGTEQTVAQGINLIYFLPCAAMALFSHVKNGLVEKSVLLPAALAGAVTAPAAAYLATSMDAVWLRKGFGVFLLIIGIAELLKKGD
ncbi:MAG: TSUP family transporter [Oscillospiraceae bacterium]